MQAVCSLLHLLIHLEIEMSQKSCISSIVSSVISIKSCTLELVRGGSRWFLQVNTAGLNGQSDSAATFLCLIFH